MKLSKISSLKDVLEDVWSLREVNRLKLSWTNGCFDILGPHHVYLLQEARKHGDKLVVGINSDSSVKMLKGDNRPIQSLDIRCMALSVLDCVDAIIPFHEPTPVVILRELRPHAIVKANMPDRCTDGDEYAEKIVLLPPLWGWSTSDTIQRVLAKYGDKS